MTGRATSGAPVTSPAAKCLRYNFIERPSGKNDNEHHFVGALMQRPALFVLVRSWFLASGVCGLFCGNDPDPQVAKGGKREDDPRLDRGAPHEICTMEKCQAEHVQHCRQLQLALRHF